ncbi:lipoprotein [Polaromonas sp.]|uniref:LPS translocon maturation chaperone LptM n=1 Tax=Polaromonas sp. TaxID=1869339 RepID=UPI003568BDE8
MFARFHIRLQILGRGRDLFPGHGLCTLALALAGAASLGACGQKGPLFFPPPPKTVSAPGVTPTRPATTAAPVATPDIPQPPPAAPQTSAPR